jgi:8-oxo-dGTP pyrophosphatase MutT (NUDIX family)
MPTDTVRVIAAVVSHSGRLLLGRRPLHKRHGGLWEFPGGKCEPGESDLEAARRELREELGLDVLTVGPAAFAIADPGSPFEIVFVPVTVAGTPVCHEHMALAWLPLAELPSLPLAPSDRRFVELCLGRAAPEPPNARQATDTLLADLEAGPAPRE